MATSSGKPGQVQGKSQKADEWAKNRNQEPVGVENVSKRLIMVHAEREPFPEWTDGKQTNGEPGQRHQDDECHAPYLGAVTSTSTHVLRHWQGPDPPPSRLCHSLPEAGNYARNQGSAFDCKEVRFLWMRTTFLDPVTAYYF